MRTRKGQGTVELALMVPLLFAIAFMVIEFAFYFGAIHWDNYAAFAAARGVQVGQDVGNVQQYLLSGNIHQYMHDGAFRQTTVSDDGNGATVNQPWDADFPGVEQLLGDMSFQVSVVLGPDESRYENTINQEFADNNVR